MSITNKKITIAEYHVNVPYNICLINSLKKKGIKIIEGDFSIKWILSEIKNIDYFHFHWPSFFYNYKNNLKKTIYNCFKFLVYLLIIKSYNKKIIWTAHNLYPHDSEGLYLYIDKFVRKLIVRLSSIIFVHGKTSAIILEKEFPSSKKKIEIIYHGNWIEYYKNNLNKQQARKLLNISDDCYVYLYFGICKKYKNIHYLITQFNKLNFKNSILLIVGKFKDNNYYNYIKKISERNKYISVYNKYIPDDEVQVYLNAADVIVLPYKSILTSGAVLLALSFGKPVIAPKIGNLIDLINNNCGILYDNSDPEGLVNAMKIIKKINYDQNHIINYAKKFSWDDLANNIVKKLL